MQSFPSRPRRDTTQPRPLPRYLLWVVKLPRYKEALQQLLAVADLPALLPALRLGHYKDLMCEAARIARDGFSDRFRDTAQMRLHNVVLMGRLIARSNVSLARKLIASSAFVVARLKVSKGTITAVDAKAFSEEYSKLMAANVERQAAVRAKEKSDSRRAGKVQASVRLAKLWESACPRPPRWRRGCHRLQLGPGGAWARVGADICEGGRNLGWRCFATLCPGTC